MENEPVGRRAEKPGPLALLQALSVVALLTLPSALFSTALWKLPEQNAIYAFGAGYLLGAGFLVIVQRQGRALTALDGLAAVGIGYVPALVYLMLAYTTSTTFSRKLLFGEIVLGALLLGVTFLLRSSFNARAAAVGLLALAGVGLQVHYRDAAPAPRKEVTPAPPKPGGAPVPAPASTGPAKPHVKIAHRSSVLYELTMTSYREQLKKLESPGGGLAWFGNDYLLGTGDGDMYVVTENPADHGYRFTPYGYKAPMNKPDFLAAIGKKVSPMYFRMTGMVPQELGDKMRLFVSHHFWNVPGKCFTVRVSMIEGPKADVLAGKPGMAWKTIFETTPCISIETADRPPFFEGREGGGRMALLSDSELLVTIGDHSLDGLNAVMSAAQDPKNDFGKIISINLADMSHQLFSLGHRNPQGLSVNPNGVIWETEHGPQGGDELNLVKRGGNYGWPLATYGTEYGARAWPTARTPGSHDGDEFTQPYYAFVPSIGISNVIVVDSPLYPLWKGDLLIASLKDRAFHRARVRDSRVVSIERIGIGDRIRDVIKGRHGEILFWTDTGSFNVLVPTADTEQSGESIFGGCLGCHIQYNGHGHRFGPDLFKIVNKPVASSNDYQYSPALKAFGGVWTKDRLDKFLEDPRAVVPGTTMQFNGIKDASSRQRLITYLETGEAASLGENIVSDPAQP
ncbi:MAG: PQQ-dependent sugar dehydrogenase [Byssovorax sp.]